MRKIKRNERNKLLKRKEPLVQLLTKLKTGILLKINERRRRKLRERRPKKDDLIT